MKPQQLPLDSQDTSVFLSVNRYEVEENAVLLDFDQAKMLAVIGNYKDLGIYVRQSLSKNLSAIREICNGDPLFYKLLEECASDGVSIKEELLKYLHFLIQKQEEIENVQLLFVRPLIKLMSCHEIQIKEDGCGLLSEITHRLTAKQKRQILELALQLQRSDDEENKIIAIQLIAKLTPDMGSDEAMRLFEENYLRIYSSASVRVKKEIILNTAIIAKNVPKQFLEKNVIHEFVQERCKQAIWGIRKACIEILPGLVSLTEDKKETLTSLLLALTRDSNKIVKVAALKSVPEFVANYHSTKVPEKLIQIYINLIDNEVNILTSNQNQIATKVSFYFPGVMYTLGASAWPRMEKLFTRLLFSKANEVRLPIASSLHEISRIIGPQLSKEYMFTALDNILQSGSDLIKLTAISHLSEFVELFEKSTRENLIDVFLVLQKDPKKWRIRLQIASQLNTLSKIYETETVFKYIFPISLKLCNDSVSEVRQTAAQQIYYVIDNMKQCPSFQQMAVQSIKGYAYSQKWVQRETFAIMVKNICQLSIFQSQIMETVTSVAKDAVPNVRICLAMAIAEAVQGNLRNREFFKEVIQILMQDHEEISEYLL